MIIIVDNFTSFVKQHESSSIESPPFLQRGDSTVPANPNLGFTIISDMQNRIICNDEKNKVFANFCVDWQELHFI